MSSGCSKSLISLSANYAHTTSRDSQTSRPYPVSNCVLLSLTHTHTGGCITVALEDLLDRAGLRGYVQFNKHTHTYATTFALLSSVAYLDRSNSTLSAYLLPVQPLYPVVHAFVDGNLRKPLPELTPIHRTQSTTHLLIYLRLIQTCPHSYQTPKHQLAHRNRQRCAPSQNGSHARTAYFHYHVRVC